MKSVIAVIFLTGGLLLTSPRCPAQAPTRNNSEEFDSIRERVSEAYGQLPLSFEANRGQANREVRFLSRRPGYTLFLTSSEAVLVAGKSNNVARMKLNGSNRTPKVWGLDQLSGKSYYFIGNDPKKWQNAVPNYARVRYQAVYPGIDLIYHGTQRQLEYDFVVAPGADPKSIQLSFPGARQIRIDRKSGDLTLDCAGGEVRFRRPVAYQGGDGDGRAGVEARYVLKKGDQVSIAVGGYDVTKPLIIDPVLSYSTYLGGTGLGISSGIAVDSLGNAYVTGYTTAPNFPTTAHSIPAPPVGIQTFEGFVSKLSFDSVSSTLSLVYSTYLGGSGLDEPRAIAVDSFGNAYVAGYTISPDFPTVHSLPASQAGGTAFVSKLSFDGLTSTLSLVYSTLLGGGEDGVAAIAVDTAGNAYVAGSSPSPNFPTVHPLPSSSNPVGYEHTFVSKLSFNQPTSTLSLVYSTFLCGDAGSDVAGGIAVDASGNAYVTGWTNSTGFPTVHPLPAPNGASQSGINTFVSELRFDSATSTLSLAYSTFLGGSNDLNGGQGIAVDSSGDVYVTGRTGSSDFPTVHPLPIPSVTLQMFQAIPFVSKLSFDDASSTLSLVYSTFLGGSSGIDEAYGIALDAADNAYVTGNTSSADFPIANPLPAPNNTFHGPGSEVFVSKLNFDRATSTLTLAYSTFLGGGGYGDDGFGIAVDTAGNAYVVGDTDSAKFPVIHPLPAPDDALRGAEDSFVAKISSGIVAPLANAGPDQTAQVGMLVTLDGSASSDPAGPLPLTYAWSFVSKPAGSTVKLSDPHAVDPTFTPDAVGDYQIQLVVTNAAGVSSLPATVTISTVNSPPVADAGPDQAITVIGTVVHLNGLQSDDPDGLPITYQWSILSKPAGSKASLTASTTAQPSFIADVHGDYTIQLIVKDSLGVVSKPAVLKVSFNNVPPVANAGLNQSAIVGETVTLNGSGSTDANGDKLAYQWSVVSAPFRDHTVISHSTAEIASFVPDLPGTYVVQLIVNDGFVNSAPATVEIEVVRPGIELTREIRSLQRVIAELAPKAFRHRKLQGALLSKLNAVLRSLRERDYRQALQQLENDILVKTNGCATAGAPDRNDWIIDCRDQSRVYPMLLNIILEVKEGERSRGQNGER
jgi:Beta-propeller repeat/PKD domain